MSAKLNNGAVRGKRVPSLRSLDPAKKNVTYPTSLAFLFDNQSLGS